MKRIWRVAKWRGVPVRMGWTVLLALPMLAMFNHSWTYALLALPAYLAVMLVHELGHAWVAHHRGTRVTGIELHGMHGLCRYEQPYYALDDFLIAWGGVAAQLLLLALAAPFGWLLRFAPHTLELALRPTFTMLVWANLLMIMFNLLPVQGLDGWKAWRALPYAWEWLMERAPRWRWPRRKPGGRLRVVPSVVPLVATVQPDLQQQMRALPDEAESPEATTAAAELLERLKRR